MCKERILSRSTNFLSKNHSTLCFWFTNEEGQMPDDHKLYD